MTRARCTSMVRGEMPSSRPASLLDWPLVMSWSTSRSRGVSWEKPRTSTARRPEATALTSLTVDGGASANNLLCQLQADQLGVPVERPQIVETTALGAAFLAGLGTGAWSSTDELRDTWALDRRFEPAGDRAALDAAYARWSRAVERSKGWAG